MASPKKARPLTTQFLDSLRSHRGQTRDFSDLALRGLLLRVERTGYKHWLFRYKLNKKPRRLRLGDYPEVTLAAARERAARYRALLETGVDPQMARLFGRRDWHLRPATAGPPRQVSSDPPAAEMRLDAHPHSMERLLAEFKTLFVAVEREDPQYVYRILDHEVLPYFRGRDARTIEPREIVEFLDTIVARGSKVMANRIGTILQQMLAPK